MDAIAEGELGGAQARPEIRREVAAILRAADAAERASLRRDRPPMRSAAAARHFVLRCRLSRGGVARAIADLRRDWSGRAVGPADGEAWPAGCAAARFWRAGDRGARA